jgi:hypothetical protein
MMLANLVLLCLVGWARDKTEEANGWLEELEK